MLEHRGDTDTAAPRLLRGTCCWGLSFLAGCGLRSERLSWGLWVCTGSRAVGQAFCKPAQDIGELRERCPEGFTPSFLNTLNPKPLRGGGAPEKEVQHKGKSGQMLPSPAGLPRNTQDLASTDFPCCGPQQRSPPPHPRDSELPSPTGSAQSPTATPIPSPSCPSHPDAPTQPGLGLTALAPAQFSAFCAAVAAKRRAEGFVVPAQRWEGAVTQGSGTVTPAL